MKFEIGAMSVGDIFDRGIKMMFARLPTFYLIHLIALFPVLVISLLMPELQVVDISTPEAAQSKAITSLGVQVVVIVIQLILGQIAAAATLHVIGQEFVDRRVGLGSAFAFAFRRFGSLLLASILVGLIVGFGMILCVVPGIIFFTWFVFTSQVVVMEGRGGTEAMARSKELTEGYRGRVLGVVALLFLIMVVLALILGLVIGLLIPPFVYAQTELGWPIPVGINYTNFVIYTIVLFLFNILVETYMAVCLTLFYFDLRIRKEGFDLEVAAMKQAPDMTELS